MNSSVFILEPDGGSRRRVFAHAGGIRRPRRPRLGLLLAVVLTHAAVAGLLLTGRSEMAVRPPAELLVTVYMRPRVVVSRQPSVAPRPIHVPKDAPVAYDAQFPEVDLPTITVLGVGMMAPHPDEASIDPAPFARDAGLRPGDGATIVLRLEVLGTGELGRVEVDVSGGAPEIDREAIAYARALPWIGGMVDGRPETIWVRWGVRLQA